ncbi:hypothetical protein [Trueperella bialowiezensis]|uniref:Uncharacterized protein n=1 Tax=Trueperella bialowiezensis TaxID=312285 RepID=A0A3S4UYW4_9ACTO|nr:hypothetical protein [Trueperella bialowiezensis]VEI13229.1 Uncharacterised protein [Trueperella bialowiezensis]
MAVLDLTTILADLKTWEPIMNDASHITVPAIRYTHGHTTGAQADSQVERATYAKTRYLADLETILNAAYSTGWRDEPRDGSPYDWLTARADWGPRNGPQWAQHVTALEQVHARWQHACAPASETSDHLCPACGHANLIWHHHERLYRCPACSYAATAEQAANLRRHVIRQSDTGLTRQDASTLFDLTPAALRKHIQRGNLTPNPDGLIHTGQLRNLPRR